MSNEQALARQEPRPDPNDLQLAPERRQMAEDVALQVPGMLQMTPESAAILLEKVDIDSEIDILPTGEVYLSQVGYRRRLNRAFGPGQWMLVPEGDTMRMDTMIAQRWALWVRGTRVSVAYGEAEYQPDNPRHSWPTAWESAKSNGLMRTCKDLGIASECWDRRWTEKFKADFCVKVWRQNSNGKTSAEWRRKDAPPFFNEQGVVQDGGRRDDHPVEGARVQPTSGGVPTQDRRPKKPVTEPQLKRLHAIINSRAKAIEIAPSEVKAAVKDYCQQTHNVDAAGLTMDIYDDVCAWIEKYDPTIQIGDAEVIEEPGSKG